MNELNLQYSILPTTMIVTWDSQVYTIHRTDHRFAKVKEAIDQKDFKSIPALLDPTKVLNKEGFEVRSGVVYFKNEPLPTILGDQFLDFKVDKVSFTSLVNFWLNLKNRSEFNDSREHIVNLLNKRGYPVTEDGFIIVYREDANNNPIKFDPKKKVITPFFNYSHCSPFVKDMFDQKKTLNEIIETCFGFSTKKLVKLVTSSMFPAGDPYVRDEVLNFGVAFKGILSPNNLFLVMEKKLFNVTRGNIASYRRLNDFWQEFAKTKEGEISEKKIINLLEKNHRWEQLLDCGEFFEKIKKKVSIDFNDNNISNNVEALYNYLSREYQKLSDPEYDLHVLSNFPNVAKILDTKIGESNLTFVYPKNNYDLKEWSRKLNNCIHGYGQKVIKAESLVLAVCDDLGKMIYNIEISNGRIKQFRANHNRVPPKEDQMVIIDILFDNDLLIDKTGERC